MLRDFQFAARALRKSPVFAATAGITIGLGIGASAAIFSVTNAVLLRPLPYRNPGRLVLAICDMRKRNVKNFPISNADFLDLRAGTASVFEEVGAVNTGRQTLPREDGSPEQIRWAAITPNFFPLVGGGIVLGRPFLESDGLPQPAPQPGAAGAPAARLPIATILSYDYWKRRFGGRADVLGHTTPGAPQGATVIVGVLAPGVELFFPPSANMEQKPDVWYAARLGYDAPNRNNVQWLTVARLKDGVTVEQAQAAADRVAGEIRAKNLVWSTAGYALRIEPMQKNLVEAVRPALVALMGAVIFLLLIACANVANLMLVRAALRERELAVRTALGGSWWRLVRQMLAEALLLAAAGAALGLALAWASIRELRAIAPASVPRLDAIAIDPAVVGFSALAALGAAALFGIVPAWRAARPDIAQVLRSSGRASSLGSAGVLRNAVVVAEVALSFVLLIGSGLMFRSFLALQRIDPGFDPHHLLTFETIGGRQGQQPAERAARQREIQQRLRVIPGVDAVTASFPLPLTGGYNPIRWGLESALSDPSRYQAMDYQVVLPGYFEAMHTPLLAGRTFAEADSDPERRLVVIDQMLAGKAFPNGNAVGQRLLTRIRTLEPMWFEVIGVVAHVRNTSLAEPGREQIYFTDGYMQHGFANKWAVRTANPAGAAAAVRNELARFDPTTLMVDVAPMDALVERAQAGTRFQLLLIGVFAVVAALLAGVGLYGVLSTVVRQRTAEIGVRMALGAAPGSIFSLVVGQGLRLSAIGIAAGVAAALVLTRAMTTMLVGVRPTDPATFSAIAVLFFAIAALASWLPARRAAGLDPTTALRDE